MSTIAHVGGIPIEETLIAVGPVVLMALAAAWSKLRARVRAMKILGGMSAVAAALVLAMPGSADATTTCDYSAAGKLLSIDMPAAGDDARISRAGSDIVIRDGDQATVACTGGAPTVTNTDAISAFNQPGGELNALRILQPGSFAPGATPEAGDDEIEIFVNLNDAENSGVSLQGGSGSSGGESIRFGGNGINLNATAAEDQPDADVFLNNVPRVGALGGDGADTFGAQGGAGTGGALTNGVVFLGEDSADVLTGGEGNDVLFGGRGNDALHGMGGSDELLPGPGDETIDGGAGTDMASFGDGSTGVSVDLATGGPQNTGAGTDVLANVENLAGTEGPDVLRGDGGPNTLASGEGADLLEGRGGIDRLFADEGADSLMVRDGGPDEAACGSGTDSVTADAPAIDLLTGCETAVFPTVSGPGPGGGDTGGATSAPLGFGSKTLVTLALATRRIPSRGPVRVRVSNRNGFAVTGRLSARTTKRVSVSRKRRIVLRAKAFSIAARGRKAVNLKLPTTLRRLLERQRGLSLRVTARVKDPAGRARTVEKRVRPKLKSKRKPG